MYEFDKKNHIHKLGGKPLIGITTVLSVISKPALIQWSANMAVDYIEENIENVFVYDDHGNNVVDDVFLDELMKEAKSAHRKKRDKAGDWGTKVHEVIEDWIKNKTEPTDLDETQQKVFKLFKEWAIKNKVKFLESEKHLWSEEMWTGGIVDLVFEMDGKKYIGDIKTSSGIYNEAFFQMGAYHLMLESMGVSDIQGYIVINLKKTGQMDMKLAENMKLNQDAFKHALGLYKIINSLK